MRGNSAASDMKLGVETSLECRLQLFLSGDPIAISDPYPLYHELREQGPTYRCGPLVLVPRYEDVKAIATDATRFSSDYSRKGTRAAAVRARLISDRERQAYDEVMAFESNFLNRSDGDHHTRLHRAFTPRRIAELKRSVIAYCDRLIAALDARRDEIIDMAQFAYELPLQVICDMLGVPLSDRFQILRWGNALVSNRDGIDGRALLAAHEAWLAFDDYIRQLIAEHRRAPGAGGPFVAAMLEATEGGVLDKDEVAAEFVMMLLGGHETTSNLIGTGLLGLLKQRDQWQELVGDQSLIPTAIEELLRFVTPSQLGSRRAIVRTEIAGLEIEPEQTVVTIRGAANRDPDIFDDPDRIDVRRENARHHLALGFGPHYCLGASLARLEADVTFRALTTAFPDMQLAVEEVSWTGPASLRRVASLPVSLGFGGNV